MHNNKYLLQLEFGRNLKSFFVYHVFRIEKGMGIVVSRIDRCLKCMRTYNSKFTYVDKFIYRSVIVCVEFQICMYAGCCTQYFVYFETDSISLLCFCDAKSGDQRETFYIVTSQGFIIHNPYCVTTHINRFQNQLSMYPRFVKEYIYIYELAHCISHDVNETTFSWGGESTRENKTSDQNKFLPSKIQCQ